MSIAKKKPLTLFALTMINVVAICNIKNFPLSSLYGLSSAFFFLLASIVYFIPISLVAAELSSAWPERGIYSWVKEAFGAKLGFVAIWLQWIENIIWYPTILSFMAATIAYMFRPELAENKLYILSIILPGFWLLTYFNSLGMKFSSFLSSASALLGTILPGILIIFLAGLWLVQGKAVEIPLTSAAFFPDLSSLNQLVIFSGILLALSGMEMSSVHALEVKDPQKGYPKAIFFSALIIIVLSTLGSIAVAIVVPKEDISLASGAMEAFSIFFANNKISFLTPIIALLMAFGALGMISTWIVGPTKGVYAAALDGDLPSLFQKSNKNKMPISLMITQAIVVSLLSLIFLLMPSVSSSYWILINMTVQLYLIMYVLMFLSALRLRYKNPGKKRTYEVPYGNRGMWIISLVGITASTFAFIIGFIPPEQIQVGSTISYESILIGGIILFVGIPYLIFSCKKKSWQNTRSATK